MCKKRSPKFSKLTKSPVVALGAGPQTALLQSSEIPDLGLTSQIENFWLTH